MKRPQECTCPGPLDPPYASTWGHYDGPVPCQLAKERPIEPQERE